MLKMYHPTAETSAGGSPEYWESAWSDGAFEEALRFCDVDPLRPLLEEFLRPGARVLEGGCGRGQYVACYTARGARVVGLDFATAALARLGQRHRGLRLCGGDVSRLPFRAGSFDAYYSGGVVEHFEGGPLDALREARRVLVPGGTLLVSVPYLSPLRRTLSFMKDDRRRVPEPRAAEPEDAGRRFFQYAFAPGEFAALLREAGFEVTRTQGYAIYFGLMELPILGPLLERLQRRRSASLPAGAAAEAAANGPVRPVPPPSLAKRLLVSEDASVPVAGAAVRLLRWGAANMMMYVCRPSATR